jgi:hypothetical protein
MKLIAKCVIATLAAIAVGVVFYYAFNAANGFDPTTNREEALSLNMVQAKMMFQQKNDPIQRLTAYIWEDVGFTAVRKADGSVLCLEFDGSAADTNEYQDYLNDVFGEYENGGIVYNIAVTGAGTYFYTSYSDDGVCGFVSENIIDNTQVYDTLELVETWKIFFKENK